MFSIQLITLNYPLMISHRRSTTVSLETHALNADKLLKTAEAVGWTRLSNCTVRYRKRSVFIKSFILWLIQQVVDIIYLDPLSLVIFLLTVHHWDIYIYTHVWAVSWAIMMADVKPMSLLTVLPNSEEQVEPTAAKPKNWLNDEVFCS